MATRRCKLSCARLVDDAHTAAAGLAQDFVARELREDDGRKRERPETDWRPSVSRLPCAAPRLPRRRPRRRGRRSGAATSRPRRRAGCGRRPPGRRRPDRRRSAGGRRSRGCLPGEPTRARPATARPAQGWRPRSAALGRRSGRPCARPGGRAGFARQAATSRPPRGAAGRRWRQGAGTSSGPGTPGARDRWHTGHPARTSQIRARATWGRSARRRTISGRSVPADRSWSISCSRRLNDS